MKIRDLIRPFKKTYIRLFKKVYLDKAICQSCKLTTEHPPFRNADISSLLDRMSHNACEKTWHKEYDQLWDEGVVACPFYGGASITKVPHEYCPHALEHLMITDTENAK